MDSEAAASTTVPLSWFFSQAFASEPVGALLTGRGGRLTHARRSIDDRAPTSRRDNQGSVELLRGRHECLGELPRVGVPHEIDGIARSVCPPTCTDSRLEWTSVPGSRRTDWPSRGWASALQSKPPQTRSTTTSDRRGPGHPPPAQRRAPQARLARVGGAGRPRRRAAIAARRTCTRPARSLGHHDEHEDRERLLPDNPLADDDDRPVPQVPAVGDVS